VEDIYGDVYMKVFREALGAAVEAIRALSDEQVDLLARYSGVVGLAAEHVKRTRGRALQQAPRDELPPAAS
jgi:hypothetical protein